MTMKKLVVILITILLSLSGFAQSDSERMAKTAFSMGNYSDAIELYKAAIALESDQSQIKSLTERLNISRNTYNKLKEGLSLYNNKEFEAAIRSFQYVLSNNSDDDTAKAYIKKCEDIITRSKKEDALWAEVSFAATLESNYYYLKEYPDGKYVDQAKDNILFFQAQEENTSTSYKNYLENSQLKIYELEAQKKYEELSFEEDWNITKRVNTESAYREFIDKHPGKSTSDEYLLAGAYIDYYNALELYYQKNYQGARELFDKSFQYLSGTDFDFDTYRKCEEEDDWGKINDNSPSTQLLEFEKKYPNTSHKDDLYNKMFNALCNEGKYYSAENYATTDEQKRICKKHKRKRALHIGYVGYMVKMSTDLEVWDSYYSYTLPRVEFSIGDDYYNKVNLLFGLQYRKISGWAVHKNHRTAQVVETFGKNCRIPHLVANQIGVPITFRLNFDSSYMGFGGTANYNYSSKYKRNTKVSDDGENEYEVFGSDQNLHYKYNFDTFLKFGFIDENKEWSFYIKYDITPVFDLNAVNSTTKYKNNEINPYQMLKPIQKQANNNLSVGISYTINFKW